MNVEVIDTPEGLAQRAAKEFVKVMNETLLHQERFTVLLSGGRTPQALYKILGSSQYRDEIPWKKIFFFWGDERFVAPTHPDSNYRMVQETLLGHVPIPERNILKVPTEMPEAKEVAKTYEKRIREFFELPHGIPSFDLALMGMGADGHTASMFPDSDYKQLSGGDTLVIAPYVTHLKAYRISLTLKVFNACKHIIFAVAGADKKKVFLEIQDQSREGLLYPAATVKPSLWLVLKEVVA